MELEASIRDIVNIFELSVVFLSARVADSLNEHLVDLLSCSFLQSDVSEERFEVLNLLNHCEELLLQVNLLLVG